MWTIQIQGILLLDFCDFKVVIFLYLQKPLSYPISLELEPELMAVVSKDKRTVSSSVAYLNTELSTELPRLVVRSEIREEQSPVKHKQQQFGLFSVQLVFKSVYKSGLKAQQRPAC